MDSWRERMRKADAAKGLLLKDRERGERAFDELLTEYPLDGMVYFKRAEGWQYLEQWNLALSDYKRAASRFPMEAWRERARQGIRFVEEQLAQEESRADKSGAPACDFSGIDPQTSKNAQEAFEKITSEPRAALVLIRTVVEALADALARDQGIAYAQSDSLAAKIHRLAEGHVVSPVTASHMHTCRVLGNEAAHRGLVVSADAEASWKALQAIHGRHPRR